MTAILPEPTAAPSLLEDNAANEYIRPDDCTPEQLTAICNGLEALFITPEPEEKRDYPHELSTLVQAVFKSGSLVMAVNAGDGSMLTAFDPAYCFGIEPEEKRSRKRQGRYLSIVGELPRVSKLMEPLGCELYDTVTVFREDTDTQTVLDFLSANLHTRTNLVYIAHGEKHRELLDTHPSVYARLKIADADYVIYFGGDPDYLKNSVYADTDDHEVIPVAERSVTFDMIDLLGPWVAEQKDLHTTAYSLGNMSTSQSRTYKEYWQAIHREYGRRFLREDRVYDITLEGKKTIAFNPSEWAKLALSAQGHSNLAQRIKGRDISFFAQHSGLWRELLIMEDEGSILIDPTVKVAVDPIIAVAERATAPLRTLKPQERLGYLSRQSKIKCIAGDDEAEFVEGKYYRVTIREEAYERTFHKSEKSKKSNELVMVLKKRRYMHQRITIGHHSYYDDDPNDIQYILRHFDVPAPPSIREAYPELVDAEFDRYTEIEKETLEPRGFKLKAYQKNDLAALSANDRGVLAWQQGLGKTVGGLAFAHNAQKKTGKDLPVLLICPQDLIPQWIREAKEKFGVDLQWIGRHKGQKGGQGISVEKDGKETNISSGAIMNLIEARQVAKHVKQGKGGWYITHFEALTMGGARNLRLVEEPYTIRVEKTKVWKEGEYRVVDGVRRWFEGEYQEKEKEITTQHECPECGSELGGRLYCGSRRRKHQNDPYISTCTWSRYVYKLPNIGQVLSTTFRNGVILVDEGTQIASARGSNEYDASQKTKSVLGMRAKYRLVMSGTPVKNFIAQAFWLLWWGVGGRTKGADGTKLWNPRFPYAFHGGKKRFAEDYTVLEWTRNDDTGGWNNVKEVGEVTNHTRLWSQFAAVLLRRVKEETGELIPKKEVHVIHNPMGYYQREQMDFWLRHFPDFWAEKNPTDPKVKRGIHRGMAAILGLDVKLNYASVLPNTDPDHSWTSVPVSNFTPSTLKALETTLSLAKQGRQVLVGTDLKAASGWLCARLNEKGVNARSMLKNNGSGDTLDPAERAKVVEEFQAGEIQVLVSTQKAIRLGHNLDKGSAVVLFGLDWDYETYAQFTERVHRLTSKRPVDVYVIVSGEENLSMIGRKWDVIKDKAKGASMAIDGTLPEQHEDPVDVKSIVAEMIEKGIQPTGNEVREAAVSEAWTKTNPFETFTIPEGFENNQAKPWVIDWDKANAALEEYLAVKAAYEAEEAEIAAENEMELYKLCVSVVDKAVCESLEAFFAGATREVPIVTNFSGREISQETTSDGTPSEGVAEGTEPLATAGAEVAPPSTTAEDGHGPEASPSDGQLTLLGAEPELPGGTPAAPAVAIDYMGQLKQAAELHQLGILTNEEFAELKAQLLAGLKAAA